MSAGLTPLVFKDGTDSSRAAAQSHIKPTSCGESLALRCNTVYARSGILPSDTASQTSMRSLSECGRPAHWEKSSFARPRLTSLDTIHETGATLLYQGQRVLVE